MHEGNSSRLNTQERRQLLRLLRHAQDGEVEAQHALIERMVYHFRGMLRNFGVNDPAFTYDDMLQEFRLGMWAHLDVIDGRGDPLYHLALRGYWSVCSVIQTVKRRVTIDFGKPEAAPRFSSLDADPTEFLDRHADTEAEALENIEVRESRDEAHELVAYIRTRANFSPRERDTLEWMLTHEHEDKGYNKQLARDLGVSPQRASVLRQRVLDRLA